MNHSLNVQSTILVLVGNPTWTAMYSKKKQKIIFSYYSDTWMYTQIKALYIEVTGPDGSSLWEGHVPHTDYAGSTAYPGLLGFSKPSYLIKE